MSIPPPSPKNTEAAFKFFQKLYISNDFSLVDLHSVVPEKGASEIYYKFKANYGTEDKFKILTESLTSALQGYGQVIAAKYFPGECIKFSVVKSDQQAVADESATNDLAGQLDHEETLKRVRYYLAFFLHKSYSSKVIIHGETKPSTQLWLRKRGFPLEAEPLMELLRQHYRHYGLEGGAGEDMRHLRKLGLGAIVAHVQPQYNKI